MNDNLIPTIFLALLAFLFASSAPCQAADQPTHPGNIFLLGAEVVVPLPEGQSTALTKWTARDDRLQQVAQGAVSRGLAHLGKLPTGWYRVDFHGDDAAAPTWTTAAVLTPIKSPIPADSPIAVDIALSWHEEESTKEWQAYTDLAALAGVKWVRDRLNWRHVQTAPSEFVPHTKYDTVAELQARAGLKVLQTYHRTPDWAVEEAGRGDRVPGDLRHTYAFCKAMAQRFGDRVPAWEPWNEGNAHNFGGHVIDELCAHQKAAYLGFKAGNPNALVGWNPLGGINNETLAQGIIQNETWPYFDTYNIHSYDWCHDYEKLWKPAREAASGRPIWVTECDRGMKAETGAPWGDFSHDFALRKAEFIIQSYASSLCAGASVHFHFLLRYYMEGSHTIQFGLLRKDMTPRLSYVALATLGRQLAGARPLGRWQPEGADNTWVCAFRAAPDGVEKDVLVAWCEAPVDWPRRGAAKTPWPLPAALRVDQFIDYLGRPLPAGPPEQLTSTPLFLIMPKGEASKLPLNKAPAAEWRPGQPSPVVLQLRTPEEHIRHGKMGWTHKNDRVLTPGSTAELELRVYNFAGKPLSGEVLLTQAPQGWHVTPTTCDTTVAPMDREILPIKVQIPSEFTSAQSFKFQGHFPGAGRTVLAFDLAPPSPSAD